MHADVLKTFSLFAGLAPQDIETIMPLFENRTYRAGEDIYQAGDPSEHIHLILSGAIDVYYTLNNETVTLAQLHAGLFFGEAGVLEEKQKHQTRARAVLDTNILSLSSKNFNKLTKNKPHTAAQLLINIGRILAHRLDTDAVRIGVISSLNKLTNDPETIHDPKRLARTVLHIALTAIPCHRAFLGIYPPHNPNELHVLASVGITPKELPQSQDHTSDEYMPILARAGSIRLTAEEYHDRAKVRYAKKNLLGELIQTDESHVGVIILADKKDGDFSARNHLLLEIIAGHVAFAFEASQQRQERAAREELKREYVRI